MVLKRTLIGLQWRLSRLFSYRRCSIKRVVLTALFFTVVAIIGLSLCVSGIGIRCDLMLASDSKLATASNQRTHPEEPAVVAINGNKLKYQGLEKPPTGHPRSNNISLLEQWNYPNLYPLDRRKNQDLVKRMYPKASNDIDWKETYDDGLFDDRGIGYNRVGIDKNKILESLKEAHPEFNINEMVENPNANQPDNSSHFNNSKHLKELTTKPDVLVLGYAKTSPITNVLEYSRFSYKYENLNNPLPNLSHKGRGKYSVVIFEKFENYLSLKYNDRDTLHAYCRTYDVGILSFTRPDRKLRHARADGFPLYINSQLRLRDMEINSQSAILNITKAGSILKNVTGSDWTVFQTNHSTYVPLTHACLRSQQTNYKYITSLVDRGQFDGIRRVIFGNSLQFWLHKVLAIDALRYLSHGKLQLTLDRYVQIDIDDIFVGKSGIRMVPDDVQALLEAQARFAEVVPGFRFNLGFSGKYFKSGTEEEKQGDEQLIEHSDSFWWFGHMWGHTQAHTRNYTGVKREMQLNKQFAQEQGIMVNTSYAVAPHHSGVYPVHEELYEAWKRVWNVKVTSTEGYPHLYPAHGRRGFIHRGIKVLPRQTCGLFTHTIFSEKYPNGLGVLYENIYGGQLFVTMLFTPVLPRQTCGLYTKNLMLSDYPGGPNKLYRSIYGGELFVAFLYTPVMVFMTHLSNYGNDRLALFTFEEEFKFVQQWTHLRLLSVPPAQLGKLYFDMYPEETEALWGNPCDDKRHVEIWSSEKSCQRLPDFLIIGPQKTGTSALYTFLNIHPSVVKNYNSPTTFEEVQFFSSKNYLEGLDWYLQFFPPASSENRSQQMYFEKSANYFNHPLAPVRISAMLPDTKLIAILIDPALRAYSWYHHQRSHKIQAALDYSFHSVVTSSARAPMEVKSLRAHCLEPGMYAYHLETWLESFEQNQILVIDGDQLKDDPITVMDQVQDFLALKPHLDYSRQIKFSTKKGFYCQIVNGDHTKCLGVGKGRTYPPMEKKTAQYLEKFYEKEKLALIRLLNKMNQQLPKWLLNMNTDTGG